MKDDLSHAAVNSCHPLLVLYFKYKVTFTLPEHFQFFILLLHYVKYCIYLFLYFSVCHLKIANLKAHNVLL